MKHQFIQAVSNLGASASAGLANGACDPPHFVLARLFYQSCFSLLFLLFCLRRSLHLGLYGVTFGQSLSLFLFLFPFHLTGKCFQFLLFLQPGYGPRYLLAFFLFNASVAFLALQYCQTTLPGSIVLFHDNVFCVFWLKIGSNCLPLIWLGIWLGCGACCRNRRHGLLRRQLGRRSGGRGRSRFCFRRRALSLSALVFSFGRSQPCVLVPGSYPQGSQ